MATEPFSLDRELEILDPVLAYSSPCVEFVESLRPVDPRSHHEARICHLLHGLGLVDDPALPLPACSPVEIFTEEPLLPSLGLMQLRVLIEQIAGERFDAGVGDQAYGVVDALLFAVVVEGGNREPSVRPYLYAHPGPFVSQAADDSLQDGYRRAAGMSIASPEERRDQMATIAVEDEQGMVYVLLMVAVVVGALLLAVDRVVGRVEVQKHLIWRTVLPRSLR